MALLNFDGNKSFIVPFPKLKNVFFDASLSYQYLKANDDLLKELKAQRAKYSSESYAFIVLKKPKKDKVIVCQISLALFSGLESKLIASAIWNIDPNNVSAFVHHYCEKATGAGFLALEMPRLKQLCQMYNSQDGAYIALQKSILNNTLTLN